MWEHETWSEGVLPTQRDQKGPRDSFPERKQTYLSKPESKETFGIAWVRVCAPKRRVPLVRAQCLHWCALIDLIWARSPPEPNGWSRFKLQAVACACVLIFRTHATSLRPTKELVLVLRRLCRSPPAICNGKRRRLSDRSSGTKSVVPHYLPQH